ncbi:MAG TPA: hypothetical protein DCF71_12220, partial [Gemmatimonadetes bacterium]|nr:hypothetical protein [Gemmatimonadota bacterium]
GDRGSVSPSSSITDSLGQASAAWTLGTAVGTDSVRVSVDGISLEAYFVATVQGFRLELSADSLTFSSLGAQDTLTAQLLGPANLPAGDTDITWTSSDESVATVSSSGVVTAVANG